MALARWFLEGLCWSLAQFFLVGPSAVSCWSSKIRCTEKFGHVFWWLCNINLPALLCRFAFSIKTSKKRRDIGRTMTYWWTRHHSKAVACEKIFPWLHFWPTCWWMSRMSWMLVLALAAAKLSTPRESSEPRATRWRSQWCKDTKHLVEATCHAMMVLCYGFWKNTENNREERCKTFEISMSRSKGWPVEFSTSQIPSMDILATTRQLFSLGSGLMKMKIIIVRQKDEQNWNAQLVYFSLFRYVISKKYFSLARLFGFQFKTWGRQGSWEKVGS